MKQAALTFADLFCGIGGFHYAAASLGMECVFACDLDEAARAQYRHNFGLEPQGDITQIDAESIPDHDLLCAGFPCQPFSIIGQRRGLNDSRGRLIYDVARVLRAKRPAACVLENVRQLATIGGGRALETLLDELRAAGYATAWRVLNALDYGLPQKRERVIIVGFRDARALTGFAWPAKQGAYAPLASVLETAPDPRHAASAHIRARRKAAHTASVSPAIWHENKGGAVSSHPFSCALRAGASYNYLLVDGVRRLTPRECLRLQGFPESFRVVGADGQIRKQTGNAVPVPMVRAVIKEMLRVLDKNTLRLPQKRAVSSQSVSPRRHRKASGAYRLRLGDGKG